PHPRDHLVVDRDRVAARPPVADVDRRAVRVEDPPVLRLARARLALAGPDRDPAIPADGDGAVAQFAEPHDGVDDGLDVPDTVTVGPPLLFDEVHHWAGVRARVALLFLPHPEGAA